MLASTARDIFSTEAAITGRNLRPVQCFELGAREPKAPHFSRGITNPIGRLLEWGELISVRIAVRVSAIA